MYIEIMKKNIVISEITVNTIEVNTIILNIKWYMTSKKTQIILVYHLYYSEYLLSV